MAFAQSSRCSPGYSPAGLYLGGQSLAPSRCNPVQMDPLQASVSGFHAAQGAKLECSRQVSEMQHISGAKRVALPHMGVSGIPGSGPDPVRWRVASQKSSWHRNGVMECWSVEFSSTPTLRYPRPHILHRIWSPEACIYPNSFLRVSRALASRDTSSLGGTYSRRMNSKYSQ
jgi:hypothetical protein